MASKENRRIKATALCIIWIVFLLLIATTLKFEVLRDIESQSWDWRLRAVARSTKPDPQIKIIMIDQESINQMAKDTNYWPWPRSIYNPVLMFLKAAGARAVAFDMLFTEKYNTVDDDLAFAEAVGGTIPVVSSLAIDSKGAVNDEGATGSELLQVLARRQREQPPFKEKYFGSRNVVTSSQASLPIPELLNTSGGFGNVAAEPDDDKIFRRIAPGRFLGDIPVLGLPFALHHLIDPTSDIGGYLNQVADKQGEFLLKFHGPAQTYPWYSIYAVISSWVQLSEGKQPTINPSEFKDSLVLIGPGAAGLLDFRPGPFPGNFPGVEINATALDNILHRDFMCEVPLGWAILIAAIGLALVVTTSMYFVRFQVVVLAGLFATWVFVCFLIAEQGYWLPMINPLFGMILATITSVAFQYQLEGKQHKFIKDAFQHYVTPEVIEQIVADPSSLALGGERRDLTIFFSDIAGFTTLSESMEPAMLVQFLNKFLSEMTDIILASGGTIDKYEGDAIIAFWNAPISFPDHHQRGVQSALLCQRRLFELREYFLREYGVAIKMRIGLNTGVVTVGNFGSTTRFNYTMIGDAANLASRLEGANKALGSRILVSDATRSKAVDGIVWRRLGDIRVVGKSEVVTVWEPLDRIVNADCIALLPIYNKALEQFEGGDLTGALESFKKLTTDTVSQSYVARIENMVSIPEEEFSAVWNLMEK